MPPTPCSFRRRWPHLHIPRFAAPAAVVLAVMLAPSCITRTHYPDDWAARNQHTAQFRQKIPGHYLNRGLFADAKKGRRPVLLTDLLSLSLETHPDLIIERLHNPERAVALAPTSEVVTLEILEIQDPILRLLPTKYRESAKRGGDAADAALSRIIPVQRRLRFSASRTSPSPRDVMCMLHSDGQVDVVLMMSQGSSIILKLTQAADGTLVGRLVDESGGLIVMIPYFSSSDSWVRFEPARPR